MLNEENIHSLSVEDLLGLLNSPQKEIVKAVRTLIKDQFSAVSDRCLVAGFMDYYFLTNSKHILDLLLGAPEPHSKYLLEKISWGLRSGDRFFYLSILLYAISRNPPPIWLHRLPNTVLKDLLEILIPSQDSDLNVLVSGVMVLVLLLPVLPYEFKKHLSKLFDCFWKLAYWTPCREQDIILKPYLQVAVYSLFHRLYALYPCNLLGFLRVNMVGQSNKSWFLNTLQPMLEQVRLHPLLVFETKETEIHKSRWVGLEPNDLIHECAKLSLDPLHEICEEMHLSYPSHRQNLSEIFTETSDFISLCSTENSFWSPGVAQSPSTTSTSVPHTPVYALQLLGNQSIGIAESPPEAAVEATPETTPFTSPTPYTAPKQDTSVASGQIFTKLKIPPKCDVSQENCLLPNPLSPVKRDVFPFKLPSKHNQDIVSKFEKSDILQMKLQEIQLQRIVRQKEDLEHSKPTTGICKRVISFNEKQSFDSKIETSDGNSNKEILRKRKLPVFINKDLETLDSDLFCEEKEKEEKEDDDLGEKERDGFSENESSNVEIIRKNSDESETNNYEGLGIPSRHSMTELVKNVKTNRLRFLSQCGPPPNISLLNEFEIKSKSLKKFNKPPSFHLKRKSWSSPDLRVDRMCWFPSDSMKRDFTISSTLSPVKPLVEVLEAATQTEEIPILDPYEQLLELSLKTLHENKRYLLEVKSKYSKSPYEHLDQFIEYWCRDSLPSPPEVGINISNGALSDATRNHLRAIQCERMCERYKREVHAERNRRLLGKVKRLHLLQEKDLGMYREMNAMKEEVRLMHNTLDKLQEEKAFLEIKVNDMVEKQILFEVQEKQQNAFRQRDHLKLMCETLQKEKSILTKEIENLKSSFREFERQHKVHMRHSTENSSLRYQVENLNKKLLIMGEIQLEMHQQMKNYKESQRHYRSCALAQEKALFLQRIQELEYKNKTEKLSLEAAMFRIRDLERKLTVGKKESLNLREEVETTVASWKERCDALEKRNKELNSVNITLENRITHFKSAVDSKRTVEKSVCDGQRTCAISDGFLPYNSSLNCPPLLEPSSESYIGMMTSTEFRAVNPRE